MIGLLGGLWAKLLGGLAVVAAIAASLVVLMRGARKDGERDERLRQMERETAASLEVRHAEGAAAGDPRSLARKLRERAEAARAGRLSNPD